MHASALQDLIAGQSGPGLVTHWQQRRGLLSAAGASRLLRIWDLGSEQLWAEWNVPGDTCVTVLASRPEEEGPSENGGGGGGYRGSVLGGVMAAGMANGTVKLYDEREGGNPAREFNGHDSWIINVHFTKVRSKFWEGGVLVGVCCWRRGKRGRGRGEGSAL